MQNENLEKFLSKMKVSIDEYLKPDHESKPVRANFYQKDLKFITTTDSRPNASSESTEFIDFPHGKLQLSDIRFKNDKNENTFISRTTILLNENIKELDFIWSFHYEYVTRYRVSAVRKLSAVSIFK